MADEQTAEILEQPTETTPPETAAPAAPAEPVAEPAGDAQAAAPAAEEGQDPAERAVPTAEEYKLPEGAPPELGVWAHDNNMTQDQLDASVKKMGELMYMSRQNEKMQLRAAGEAHVKNWGDKRSYNTSIIKRALSQIDPDGALTKLLNDNGFINHPVVLDRLLSVGESMKEGGYLKGAVPRTPGQKSLAQSLFPNHPSKEQ